MLFVNKTGQYVELKLTRLNI